MSNSALERVAALLAIAIADPMIPTISAIFTGTAVESELHAARAD